MARGKHHRYTPFPAFIHTDVNAVKQSLKCSGLQVKQGDAVLYFKWAGDSMETPDGQKYVVVHESDILCRV